MKMGISIGGILGLLALSLAFGCGAETQRAHRCRCVGVDYYGRDREYAKMCPDVKVHEVCVDLDDPKALERERAE